MRVTGFNHFAIDVVDYESSLAFYRDILSFKQLETVHTPESSSTMLTIPGGCVVELIDRHGIARRASGEAAAVHHLAFDVDDVEASEAVLRKSGRRYRGALHDPGSVQYESREMQGPERRHHRVQEEPSLIAAVAPAKRARVPER